MDMVRLKRHRQHLPALLRALALDHLTTPRRHWSRQHRLAAPGAPDEVGDEEMHAVLVSLVLACVCSM
jgi:hypothetical protein